MVLLVRLRSYTISKRILSRKLLSRPLVAKSLSWLALLWLFLGFFYSTSKISTLYGTRLEPSLDRSSVDHQIEDIYPKKIPSGSRKISRKIKRIKVPGFNVESLYSKNAIPIEVNMINQTNIRRAVRIAQIINQESNRQEQPVKKSSILSPLPSSRLETPTFPIEKNIIHKSGTNLTSKKKFGRSKNCKFLIKSFNICDNDFDTSNNLEWNHIPTLILQKYLNDKLEAENRLMFNSSDFNVSDSIGDSVRPTDTMSRKYFFELESKNDSTLQKESHITIKKMCDILPLNFEGRVTFNISELKNKNMEEILEDNNWVLPGGSWSPIKDEPPCLPLHKIAIIVPYRDRLEQLPIFLSRIHKLLQKQQLEYTIFVVEQKKGLIFNKGSVMNAGFLEAWKMTTASCFIFHDIDLLPEDDRNMYSCPDQPRHLSVAVNTLNYSLPYKLLVGGVLNMKGEHFFKVNGYSNLYWGWGGEDDDIGKRIHKVGLKVLRPPKNIARYTMIKHNKRTRIVWKVLKKLLSTAHQRFLFDGLNTVRYKLISTRIHPLFTHLKVDIIPNEVSKKGLHLLKS